MFLIYLLFILGIQFVPCQFLSNDLIRVVYNNYLQLDINKDDISVKYRIVEIFSPNLFMTVKYSNYSFPYVLQASFIIPNIKTESFTIYANYRSSLWYRVLNASDIIPTSNPNYRYLTMKVNGSNSFYTSVDFSPAQSILPIYQPIIYDIWIVPIFPNGIFKSFSGDLQTVTEQVIISAINRSISKDYLDQFGINIGNKILNSKLGKQVLIANRRTYTNLIIIQAKVNDDITIQYPPIVIYGCTSADVFSSFDTNNVLPVIYIDGRCSIIEYSSSTYVILGCFVGIGFFNILFGQAGESLQMFVTQWVFFIYVSCIVFHYTIKTIDDVGKYLYAIVFGVALFCSLVLSSLCCRCCNKKVRLKLIFNILCILLIQWSLLWFGLQYAPIDYIANLAINGGISLIIFIVLLIFKEFTYTFGSMFIGLIMICCGLAMIVVESTSIIYLFWDFFGFLLTGNKNINYFSLFLKNDLIVIVILLVLVLLLGLTACKCRLKRKAKVKSETTDGIHEIELRSDPNTYGTVRNYTNTAIIIHNEITQPQNQTTTALPRPSQTNTAQSRAIQPSTAQPSAPMGPPPPYSSLY